MPTCRSIPAASVDSPNAALLSDPLADIDPADLDRFLRHLAEAAASWHRRRQVVLMPCNSIDRGELPRVA